MLGKVENIKHESANKLFKVNTSQNGNKAHFTQSKWNASSRSRDKKNWRSVVNKRHKFKTCMSFINRFSCKKKKLSLIIVCDQKSL